MSKQVKGIEQALALLVALNVVWATVNRIQNSLFETGIAFFGKDSFRVAYFDETTDVLIIN